MAESEFLCGTLRKQLDQSRLDFALIYDCIYFLRKDFITEANADKAGSGSVLVCALRHNSIGISKSRLQCTPQTT